MPALRAGIVGTGFGNEHAKVYRLVPDVDLIGLAESDEARRLQFSTDHPAVAAYTSLEGLLENEHLDILSICTPPYLHAPMTIAAARCGVRAVYVEKPMAMHLGEADQMIEACRNAKTLLVVGHQRRLGSAARTARSIIQSGRLGAVSLVHITWRYGRLEWPFATSGGGPLMYLGVHSLDLIRYLVGDIAWVQGRVHRHHRECSIESQAKAYMQTVGGIPVLLETGEEIDRSGTDVLFTNGRMRISDHQVSIREGTAPWRDEPVPLPPGTPDDRAWLVPIRAMVDGIVTSLITGAPHPVSHVEGRAALELAMAIYESHRTAGIVHLPFAADYSPLQRMLSDGFL